MTNAPGYIVCARQAGAVGGAPTYAPPHPSSFQETDPPALCFRTADDAVDFARHGRKNGDNWQAFDDLDFAKGYEKGHFEIVLKLSAGANDPKYDFVFFAVPFGGRNTSARDEPKGFASHFQHGHANLDKRPVFSYGARPVEGPNGVVPSLVRIERAKERDDIRRQIFASAFNNRFKASIRFGDGEIGRFGIDRARKNSRRISSLIQRGSKGLDCLSGAVRELGWDWLCEFDLVKFCQSVSIKLDCASMGLLLEEFLDPRIKISDVLLCAKQPALRAIEGVAGPQG
jgi:hypothetical protein